MNRAARRKAGVDSRGKAHRFGPPSNLKVGDPVRLWPTMHGSPRNARRQWRKDFRFGYGWPEYGYVERVEVQDAKPKLDYGPPDLRLQNVFVAFYGRRRSDFERKRGEPYTLRYYNTSLEKL